MANGRNPISIIAPRLEWKATGFAGGLEVKVFLLGLEGKESGSL